MGTADLEDDIDMEALKRKYSRPREELLAEARMREARGETPLSSAAGNKAASDKLSEIVMCQACQAQGIVKKQYGYRVIDETCEVCDGEGVIRKNKPKPASEELCEKVRKVEALVEEVAELHQLERLEAALQERTIGALDAVLADAQTW